MWPNLNRGDFGALKFTAIRAKPNICIYLESIRVALSYQAQKDLITFKH